MTYDIHKTITGAAIAAGYIENLNIIDNTLHEKIVIATWGMGPTYRDRIKYNIQEAYESGYGKLMKFAILTDYTEDFINLEPHIQDLIIGVYDINEIRKNDEFSFEFEPIPKNVIDDEQYANEWRYFCDNENKLMSYALKRYLLKAIADTTDYVKVFMIDSDVELPYKRLVSGQLSEQEFWEQFNTPENTIRGCGYEELKIVSMESENRLEFIYGRSVGSHDSVRALQASTVVAYNYFKQGNRLQDFRIIEKLSILEGPVRFFNFSNKEKMLSFFDTFNQVTKLFLQDKQLYSCNVCGGYILCDYLTLALAMLLENVKSFHFSGKMFQYRVFHEDRFFGPSWYENHDCNGKKLHLLQARSKKEFLEINEELISCMKKINQWPSIAWSCF